MAALTPVDVRNLYPRLVFELIPDCPAATAAGYTQQTRETAQCWYPPIAYDLKLSKGKVRKCFIYTAWHGNILDFATKLSSILICRDQMTGELVYAKNCADYNLDSSYNFMGERSTVCRVKLFELDDRLYLCNSSVCNLGPQLFCVNAKNGDHIWSAAYYPPVGSKVKYITKPGDYSHLIGGSVSLSDLCPTGGHFKDAHGKSHTLIFVGAASYQNVINYNIKTGGFPVYTDQGQCVCIEDLGATSSLYWMRSTCAPPIKVGDVISSKGPAALDPFRPGQNKVILFSVTSKDNYFIQPNFMQSGNASPELVTPLVANVIIKKNTVINAALLQPIWSSIPQIFINANRDTSYDIDGVLAYFQAQQALMPANGVLKYLIWSYVLQATIDLAISQSGNVDIGYFKFLLDGQTVEFPQDAMGLGYWGNSTWGMSPTLIPEKNLIIFECGQGHDICQDESLYYAQAALNFTEQKKPMLNTFEQFMAGSPDLNLEDVKYLKRAFTTINNSEAQNVLPKSRRGRMSFSDAVMLLYIVDDGQNKGGDIAVATRSVPWDTYSFLTDSPTGSVYPVPALDADCSSGVHYFVNDGKHLLSTATKGGLGMIIDITDLNNSIPFDYTNASAKGLKIPIVVYCGPNAALGGANYMTASDGQSLYCTQVNTPWFSGSTSSSGEFERQISQDGKIIPMNNSYVQSYNMTTGKINWETPLDNRSLGQIIVFNKIVYTQDCNGYLYAIDSSNGAILWKFNGPSIKMNGGISAPCPVENGLVWTNNFYAFLLGGKAGKNGAIFSVDPKLSINPAKPAAKYLADYTYRSWDSAPKSSANPSINPTAKYFVVNKWSADGNKCQLVETVDGKNNTYQLVAGKYKYPTLKLKPTLIGAITSCQLTFINAKSYRFTYTIMNAHGAGKPEVVTAWLNRA